MVAVLVVEASVELLLWFQDELCVLFVLLLLALLDASALWDALLELDDFADCAAFADVEFEVEFAFLALLEVELTFDAELLAAADWLALLAASVSVLEALLVPLLADAPLDALRLSAPLPEVVDVLPPLDDGLLKDELPTDVEDPFFFAEAVLDVALELEVSLLELASFAAALLFAAEDLTLLAVFALLEEEASVAAFVLFALLDAEDVSVEEALLLALSF